MAQESVFRGVINFLDKLGVYDVILPFLLVFTIMFAILEKTKVLGVDKDSSGGEYSKKNINAMVAFVVALLVVASVQLIGVINSIMSNVVLLLILAVSFLMLVGTFAADGQFSLDKQGGWFKFFMFLMFGGVVVIFLHALNWLNPIFEFVEWLFRFWDSEVAATLFFLILIVVFMWWVAFYEKKPKEKKKDGD